MRPIPAKTFAEEHPLYQFAIDKFNEPPPNNTMIKRSKMRPMKCYAYIFGDELYIEPVDQPFYFKAKTIAH